VNSGGSKKLEYAWREKKKKIANITRFIVPIMVLLQWLKGEKM
jgi:hypothetical protein